MYQKSRGAQRNPLSISIRSRCHEQRRGQRGHFLAPTPPGSRVQTNGEWEVGSASSPSWEGTATWAGSARQHPLRLASLRGLSGHQGPCLTSLDGILQAPAPGPAGTRGAGAQPWAGVQACAAVPGSGLGSRQGQGCGA